MNFVQGSRELRWLPSRHHYALFRLLALVMFGSARGKTERGLDDRLYFVDPDQSALENYSVALWVTATVSALIAFALMRRLSMAAAIAIGIPLAAIALEVPLYVSGLVLAPLLNIAVRRRSTQNIRINGVIGLGVIAVICLLLARSDEWVRWVAWQFLGILVINALAAVVLFPLRSRIVRLEAEAGGRSSAR